MASSAEVANWGVANAIEQRRLYLNPALRNAYGRGPGAEVNPEALNEAIDAAQRLANTLKHAKKMLQDG